MTSPKPPSLTPLQRLEAYQRSLEVRRLRAEFKRYLAERPELSVDRLLDAWVSRMPVIQGMKVYDLLTAVPAIGPIKAQRLLANAGIPEKNTVRACGPRQAQRLLTQLEKRCEARQ